jgi:hypothetical protein
MQEKISEIPAIQAEFRPISMVRTSTVIAQHKA